jgi:hypothetical protein
MSLYWYSVGVIHESPAEFRHPIRTVVDAGPYNESILTLRKGRYYLPAKFVQKNGRLITAPTMYLYILINSSALRIIKNPYTF